MSDEEENLENNPLGMGGIKFQKIIQSKMRQRSPSKQFLQGYDTPKSQFDKLKIIESEDIPIEYDKESESEESKSYRLQVSSTSSDTSIVLTDEESGRQKNATTSPEEQNLASRAKQNFKQLFLRTGQNNSLSIPHSHSPIKQLNDSYNQRLFSFNNKQPMQTSQTDKQIPIKLLKGLKQNQQLSDQDELNEYLVQNKKIIVEMECKDFMTFMRLQHELEEFKRKQRDFNEQKEQHFQNDKKKKIQDRLKQHNEKYNHSWISGIALAKRLFRNFRMKKKKQIEQIAKEFTRESTLAGRLNVIREENPIPIKSRSSIKSNLGISQKQT